MRIVPADSAACPPPRTGPLLVSMGESGKHFEFPKSFFDGRGSGHLGPAVGLKTLSIHVCVCPHFGM